MVHLYLSFNLFDPHLLYDFIITFNLKYLYLLFHLNYFYH
jgi:hypothetical protein